MAMITCKECGKEVSDSAITCPHCGFKLRNYETKTVNISCFGIGSAKKNLDKKLQTFIDQGWEVVSFNKSELYSGLLVQRYTVILRKLK